MKRLYVQFYLTLIASLVLLVAAAGLVWRLATDASPAAGAFAFAGEIASAVLPEATRPEAEQKEAIGKFADRLGTDLALYSAERRLIAEAGNPLPVPEDFRERGGWLHGPGGHAWSIALPDGRWLVMREPRRGPPRRHPALGLVGVLGGLALAVAAAVYPIARRLTRRLEHLQQGVLSLGEGDLKARVKVEGRDEVADLAQSFNRAAERVEALVGAHKMLLANASHELRTPLSRIRLGIELLKSGPDPRRQQELERDIAELDELIGEILLASRLEAVEALEAREDVDLLGLAAEECARYDACGLDGTPVSVHGDPRLLRRMIRNLIENARMHGAPPVAVEVSRAGGVARIRVADHGAGIASGLRADVFKPFRRAAPGLDQRGTGLGLALVEQIARRHGGSARYEPLEPNGSVFEVSLPLDGAARPASGVPAGTA